MLKKLLLISVVFLLSPLAAMAAQSHTICVTVIIPERVTTEQVNLRDNSPVVLETNNVIQTSGQIRNGELKLVKTNVIK